MVKFKWLMAFFSFLAAFVFSFVASSQVLLAQGTRALPSGSPVATQSPTPAPKLSLTEQTEETLGPLEKLLEEQHLESPWPFNPLKFAIRGSLEAGVPANTMVLLLLLPVVAAVIAATRHLIGLRGFGIFLPASLSVVFVSTGPIVGIGIFLVIVFVSTLFRLVLRRLKVKLQYLPRMALLLWVVVLGVLSILFMAPILKNPAITNVSIFPILILVLLAEDFTRVQLGKSIRVAVNITTETLILALISYVFLTLKPLQEFALLNPEILLLGVAAFNFFVGRYVGLRLIEFWRFRKLISS